MEEDSNLITLDMFTTTEGLLRPIYYGKEIKIPKVPPGKLKLPPGMHSKFRLSKDCQWAYMYNGSVIRCISTGSGADLGLSGRRYASETVINNNCYDFQNALIKSATELALFSIKQEPNGICKLLLGLDSGHGTGALVIFDPLRAHPVKWINTPSPVVSVEIIHHFGEDSSNESFFNEAMMTMVGIAAVGLASGQILVVDLGLDELNNNWNETEYSSSDPKSSPFNLVTVQQHEELIAPKRKIAIGNRQLISLTIDSQQFVSGENGPIDGNVLITEIKYVPEIGSILVGLTCGSYQIYNLSSLQLDYSSDISYDGLPVHSFEFQQPVDDPKNYCYIWILYGVKTFELTQSRLEMAVLEYVQKGLSMNKETIYSNLKNCVKKLAFQIQDIYEENMFDESFGEDRPSIPFRFLVRPLRMWTGPPSLLFLSWQTNREGVSYIGIFDLNQWYSAQTPDSFLIHRNSNDNGVLNPFWAATLFCNPVQNSIIQDVLILPTTFMQFSNFLVPHEAHLYPASITFRAICLTSTAIFTFEKFGIQERLIRLIQRETNLLMIDPGILRAFCERFGLAPHYSIQFDENVPQNKQDQFFIFTALIENLRPALLVQLAHKWEDGSYEKLGCDIDLLFEFIYELTSGVRNEADTHWQTALSLSESQLPPSTSHFIKYSNFIWGQLKSLITILLRRMPKTKADIDDYYDLSFGIEKLVQYSATLLMLHNVSIIPLSLSPDGDYVSTMADYYLKRRQTVTEALANCPYLHPQERGAHLYWHRSRRSLGVIMSLSFSTVILALDIEAFTLKRHFFAPPTQRQVDAKHSSASIQKGHPLLIDYLLENLDADFLREEWRLEKGDNLYPPKHPGDMLSFFLGTWVHVPPKIISRIIFYFMLDLIQYKEKRQSLKGDFESIITLSSKERSEVSLLWMIDHGEFREALSLLSHVHIDDEAEGFPWSASLVILASQGYEAPVLHILKRRLIPPKISRFTFNLAYGLEPERKETLLGIIQGFSSDSSVLIPLFELAHSKGLLPTLLIPNAPTLPPSAQSLLISYIQNSPRSLLQSLSLLSIFISLHDLESAVEEWKRVVGGVGDGGELVGAEKEEYRRVQRGLRELVEMNRTASGKIVIKRKEERGGGGTSSSKDSPVRVVRAVEVLTSTPLNTLPSPELRLIPPSIRRLMERGMECRPGLTPLSPLRRYSGRVERRKPPVFSPLISSPTQGESGGGGERRRSGVDLGTLLRSPVVSGGGGGGEESGSGSGRGSWAESSPGRSIMRKKSGSLRNSLLRTRFLNLEPLSNENDEEEISENVFQIPESPDKNAQISEDENDEETSSQELSNENEIMEVVNKFSLTPDEEPIEEEMEVEPCNLSQNSPPSETEPIIITYENENKEMDTSESTTKLNEIVRELMGRVGNKVTSEEEGNETILEGNENELIENVMDENENSPLESGSGEQKNDKEEFIENLSQSSLGEDKEDLVIKEIENRTLEIVEEIDIESSESKNEDLAKDSSVASSLSKPEHEVEETDINTPDDVAPISESLCENNEICDVDKDLIQITSHKIQNTNDDDESMEEKEFIKTQFPLTEEELLCANELGIEPLDNELSKTSNLIPSEKPIVTNNIITTTTESREFVKTPEDDAQVNTILDSDEKDEEICEEKSDKNELVEMSTLKEDEKIIEKAEEEVVENEENVNYYSLTEEELTGGNIEVEPVFSNKTSENDSKIENEGESGAPEEDVEQSETSERNNLLNTCFFGDDSGAEEDLLPTPESSIKNTEESERDDEELIEKISEENQGVNENTENEMDQSQISTGENGEEVGSSKISIDNEPSNVDENESEIKSQESIDSSGMKSGNLLNTCFLNLSSVEYESAGEISTSIPDSKGQNREAIQTNIEIKGENLSLKMEHDVVEENEEKEGGEYSYSISEDEEGEPAGENEEEIKVESSNEISTMNTSTEADISVPETYVKIDSTELTKSSRFKKSLSVVIESEEEGVIDDAVQIPDSTTSSNIKDSLFGSSEPQNDESLFERSQNDESLFEKSQNDESLFEKSQNDESLFEKSELQNDESLFEKSELQNDDSIVEENESYYSLTEEDSFENNEGKDSKTITKSSTSTTKIVVIVGAGTDTSNISETINKSEKDKDIEMHMESNVSKSELDESRIDDESTNETESESSNVIETTIDIETTIEIEDSIIGEKDTKSSEISKRADDDVSKTENQLIDSDLDTSIAESLDKSKNKSKKGASTSKRKSISKDSKAKSSTSFSEPAANTRSRSTPEKSSSSSNISSGTIKNKVGRPRKSLSEPPESVPKMNKSLDEIDESFELDEEEEKEPLVIRKRAFRKTYAPNLSTVLELSETTLLPSPASRRASLRHSSSFVDRAKSVPPPTTTTVSTPTRKRGRPPKKDKSLDESKNESILEEEEDDDDEPVSRRIRRSSRVVSNGNESDTSTTSSVLSSSKKTPPKKRATRKRMTK